MSDFFSHSLAQRLVQALTASRIKQTEIADRIGVTTAAVSLWFRTGQVSLRHLPQLAEILNVSLEWLLTGQGESRPRPAQVRETDTTYMMSPDEARLLEYLRWLTSAQKDKLLSEIKGIAESNKDVIDHHSRLKSA